MSCLTHRALGALVLTAIVSTAQAQVLQTPSFVFARYASASASALYAARGLGPVGGVVAMVENPETQYRELISGVFTQLNWSGQSVLFAVAYADATDGHYAQTYLAPSFAYGRIALSGTIQWYQPLGRAGTKQLGVNPASLQFRVGQHLWIGAAYTLSLEEKLTPRHRGGPVVEWAMRKATLRVELLDRTVGEPVEIRAAVFAGF